MQSGWSVAILMIAMGALSVGGFGVQHTPTAIGWGIAGALVCSGGLLFLRQPFAWYLGLAVSGVTVATGFAAQLGKPQFALPVPPLLSIVIGLYLILRLMISQKYFTKKPATPSEDQ
jgi:hypothetical protein